MKTNLKILLPVILFFTFTLVVKAGPDNIAPQAQVTASSEKDEHYSVSNVTDGKIRMSDIGEWASKDTMPYWGEPKPQWVQLDWQSQQSINKIILYDRPDLKTNSLGGELVFSDGTKISVLQIPENGDPKIIEFPAKKVKWVRFNIYDIEGSYAGLSEIEVYPAPESYPDYVSWVNPYIETTKGRYFFFITGEQPFGMITAAPLTRNKNQFGGGYNYNSTHVLGFPQIHSWVLSGLTFMPTTGTIDPSKGEDHWKSQFSHDDEIVQPGYHRMFLKDYGTWVEQTTTERVSFYRLTYTQDTETNLLFNLGGYLANTTMVNSKVKKVSDTEFEGSFDTYGRHWGGPDRVKIYFVVRIDKPFKELNGWADTLKYKNITEFTGSDKITRRAQNEALSYLDSPTSGVAPVYEVKAGDQLHVKMSISYVSTANAWENMQAECNGWDFDQVRNTSQKEWNDWLGKIDVKGGSENQRTKFYTDLWHVLLGRHKIDDINGQYPDNTEGDRYYSYTTNIKFKVRQLPKDQNGNSLFHMYNSDAFWLTQWNLNILWGLAWPEVADDISASLIQYADNGKLIPRGPCAGGYTYIMSGCPATNLITSTYNKGILTKTDPNHAFEQMKFNHGTTGMMQVSDFYIKNGYQPNNAGMTLESAFQDWALSQMALKLNKKKDATYFAKRASGWTKLYNPKQKLIFPKDEKGNWTHLDPLKGDGWIESNAWQATWSVSHGIRQLAQLMGGNDSLCNKLNEAFEKSVDQDFVYGYGKGYVSYANQPGCSNAHVFNWVGKPWLSQYWVRRVKEQAYGAVTPDNGYGGHDEDQGQMGGVSALMAIGLFSIRGTADAKPTYEITSPVFDEVTIKLDPKYYSGKQFVIKAYDNSKKNCYIQRAALNGKPLNNFWFYHSDFAKGGILELWMGDTPNREWGVGGYPD